MTKFEPNYNGNKSKKNKYLIKLIFANDNLINYNI